ncbi:Kae1-like domain-containing protein [Oribacterium sp. HCP28S3_H8]|uniref:Kae1-like domain-containing protein n=1 Tax=Oribacterium sp. HCP28S3_H8 TaxID=3438945 RepID=UPI003F8AD0FA
MLNMQNHSLQDRYENPVVAHFQKELALLPEESRQLPVFGICGDIPEKAPDGSLWGGELLLARSGRIIRLASIHPFLKPEVLSDETEKAVLAVSMIYQIACLQNRVDPEIESFIAREKAEELSRTLGLLDLNSLRRLMVTLEKQQGTISTTALSDYLDAAAAVLGFSGWKELCKRGLAWLSCLSSMEDGGKVLEPLMSQFLTIRESTARRFSELPEESPAELWENTEWIKLLPEETDCLCQLETDLLFQLVLKEHVQWKIREASGTLKYHEEKDALKHAERLAAFMLLAIKQLFQEAISGIRQRENLKEGPVLCFGAVLQGLNIELHRYTFL